MRILHLIDAHSPDGGACTLRLLADVTQQFPGVSHEIVLIGPRWYEELAYRCGIRNAINICPPRALPWAGRQALRDWIEEQHSQGEGYDLLHAWTLRTAAMAAAMEIPSIGTLHAGPANGFASAYAIRAIANATDQSLLTSTTAVWREFRTRGLPKNRLTLLPPAVDPVSKSMADRDTVRTRWMHDPDIGIEPDDFVIGLLGEPINWIDVRAAATIVCRARLTARKVRLIVSPEAGSLAARVAAQHLPRTLALGELMLVDDAANEPWNIVAGLDAALVLGSGSRARPASSALPLLWALAAGAPIVAEASDALGDLIENEVSGCLVKPGDVNAAAERIVRLYDDRLFATALSENGRQLIAETFNISEYCVRLKHSYELLLADRKVTTLESFPPDDASLSAEAALA